MACHTVCPAIGWLLQFSQCFPSLNSSPPLLPLPSLPLPSLPLPSLFPSPPSIHPILSCPSPSPPLRSAPLQDQYRFVHEAVLEYLTSFEGYSNFT